MEINSIMFAQINRTTASEMTNKRTTKYLILTLIGLVINLACSIGVFAQTQDDREAENFRKVKLNVARIGTGKNSNAAVKLKDGTTLKGKVVEIENDYFIVTDEKAGGRTTIQYAQVKQVREYDPATKKRLFIVLGAVGVLIVLSAVVGLATELN
jgi:small nuclear ribonucleoprotein (snRNP)-like protein